MWQDIVIAWFDAYVNEKREDPHQYFADSIGVSRQEAKKMCYEIACKVYASDIIQCYCNH